jgi:acyl-[acyl-carrier-protein]-phospholipid O-acyltransferase/long-chain-fatty-acid--[acyl-carrier-protein] ligase
MTKMQEDGGSARGLRGFWGIVLAQFFGIFNDNAFRWFLLAVAIKSIDDPGRRLDIIALSGALFLLPYLLFSMHAGCLADRFSKRLVLNWSKAAEVAIMGAGILVFIFAFRGAEPPPIPSSSALEAEEAGDLGFGTLVFLFGILFLMGTQSSYYAPAKYGVLPQLLPERRLSWGNGLLELSGFFAIIIGSAAGPELLGLFGENYYLASVTFTCVAFLGLISSFLVPRVPASAPERPIVLNPLYDLLRHWRALLRHRMLLFGVLGVVYIWSLGLLFQLNIAAYAKENLGLDETKLGRPMAMIAIGVGLGSMAAGYLSGRTIELGLVILGSLGIGLSSITLFWTASSAGLTLAAVCILGFFAGFLIVPFHAYVQAESAEDDKGGMMAAVNFLQTAGMFATSAVLVILNRVFHLSPPAIFMVGGIGTFIITVAAIIAVPETLGRLVLWAAAHTTHRLRLKRAKDLPSTGPVLLLGSRVALLHGLLALLTTHKRVRLIVPAAGRSPLLVRCIAGLMRAVEVPGSDGGGALEQAARLAASSLERGESVLLATGPEGAEAVSDLIDGTRVVLLPVAIEPGAPRGRRNLTVTFGEPVEV